jgi:2-polyprenyl-6-methoxyphenol hydroxylase-like FAD-dependent oxidoreductase
VIGLSMALMLARQGYQVTVLERDGAPVPGSPGQAWRGWDRRGVAQFRQPHYLHPGGCHLLDALLPEVNDAVVRARGAVRRADADAARHHRPCAPGGR